ncbi:hypothetical protein Ancab_028827 [Ancistrocladus abbreviatus]
MVIACFICGSNNLRRKDDDNFEFYKANSTPRKSFNRNKDDKKKRSTSGLDKFCTFQEEIEEKNQLIYSQIGEVEISLDQFMYTNGNSCRTTVVKAKRKKEPLFAFLRKKGKKEHSSKSPKSSGPLEYHAAAAYPHADLPAANAAVKQKPSETTEKNEWSNKNWKCNRLQRLKQPCYYWSVILVLILVFLATFGRSVAIVCTSIGWYLVPSLTNGASNLRGSMKKKDPARKLSDKKTLDHEPPSSDPKSPRASGLHKSH